MRPLYPQILTHSLPNTCFHVFSLKAQTANMCFQVFSVFTKDQTLLQPVTKFGFKLIKGNPIITWSNTNKLPLNNNRRL